MDRLQELTEQYNKKSDEVGRLTRDKPDYNWTPDEMTTWQEGQKALTDLWDQIQSVTTIQAADKQRRDREALLERPVSATNHPDGSTPQSGQKGGIWERAELALMVGEPLNITDLSALAQAMTVEDRRAIQAGRKSLTDVVFGRKSLGEAFITGKSYADFAADVRAVNQKAYAEVPELGFKATFTTATSTLTGYDRPPGMIMVGTQRLTVADLLAQGQTGSNTIRYVQEDTYTNAATAVTEGAIKPEATFDTSEVDAPVRKIAVTAKITDELFADFPAMRDYVNERLRFMVEEREEALLISGNGTPPNITGILTTSGIQTTAFAGNELSTIYTAVTKIRAVGFFEPTGYVTHPNDWLQIRTLQAGGTGEFLWGHPSEPGIERVFGLPVVITTAITEGTSLVGAFRIGAQVFRREGIRVEATNSNEDDFKKNLIALRAEERLALAVYRPKAFCTCTGM